MPSGSICMQARTASPMQIYLSEQVKIHGKACLLTVQEEEQAVLDDEAERRRKRVQAWQEQKAKALVAEEAAAQDAAQKAKGWSLEDDLDEVRFLCSQLGSDCNTLLHPAQPPAPAIIPGFLLQISAPPDDI